MLKRTRNVWLAASTLALIAFAGPTLAQTEEAFHGDPFVPLAVEAVAEFLELAPPQVEALITLLTHREEAVAPIRAEVAALEAHLEELVALGEDPGAIGVLVLQIHERHRIIHTIQQEFQDGFESLLAPPQRVKLQKVRIAFALRDAVPAFVKLGLL